MSQLQSSLPPHDVYAQHYFTRHSENGRRRPTTTSTSPPRSTQTATVPHGTHTPVDASAAESARGGKVSSHLAREQTTHSLNVWWCCCVIIFKYRFKYNNIQSWQMGRFFIVRSTCTREQYYYVQNTMRLSLEITSNYIIVTEMYKTQYKYYNINIYLVCIWLAEDTIAV